MSKYSSVSLFFIGVLLCAASPKTLANVHAQAACTAAARTAPISMVVGGKAVSPMVPPYVGSDGQVYVPVDIVRSMGASFVLNHDGQTVHISTASKASVDVPFEFVHFHFCVALQKVAGELGMSATWDRTARTLTFLTKPRSATVHPTGTNTCDDSTDTRFTTPEKSRYVVLPHPHRLRHAMSTASTAKPVVGRLTRFEDADRSVSEGIANDPPVALGHELRGKIIMVDPGHGGEDCGAESSDGLFVEKDITLQIGEALRTALMRHGARVLMTRTDDTKPSLAARPRMAIDAGADYFISIHCDSSNGPHQHFWTTTHSGTTVYFHGDNALTRTLAADIVDRVSARSGLPGNGARSDYIRFPGIGFAVLRGLPQVALPGVLVECGYVNNLSDLGMLRDSEVQQQIAGGIAAGLIDFIRHDVNQ